jgi:hypothetical protein
VGQNSVTDIVCRTESLRGHRPFRGRWSASDPGKGATVTILTQVIMIAFSVYALVAIIFLILENRRPQATLAWALAFFFMPGLGLLIYFFFGRGWKPFAKQRQLLLQGLKGTA